MRAASFVWLGVLFVCCAGPTFVVQQYAGPQRPRESIAIIRINGGGPLLVTLDDGRLVVPEPGTRFHVEVLPGVHEIGVDDPSLGPPGTRVRFLAEADKVYRIVLRAVTTPAPWVPGWVAQAVEVDRGSDAEIRPVSSTFEGTAQLPAMNAPTPDAAVQDASRDGGD
jgi:hypothetical protein